MHHATLVCKLGSLLIEHSVSTRFLRGHMIKWCYDYVDIEQSVFMLYYLYECSAYPVCNFICCIPIHVGFQ